MRRPPIVLRSPFLAAVSSDLPSVRPLVRRRPLCFARPPPPPSSRPTATATSERSRSPAAPRSARAHFFGRARQSSHDEHVCVSQLFEVLSKRFIPTKSLIWLPVSLYIQDGSYTGSHYIEHVARLPVSPFKQLSAMSVRLAGASLPRSSEAPLLIARGRCSK